MLTILHTNDFHNQLTSTQAAKLRALRADIGDTGLLLDAGDAVAAGNITFRPQGEPILKMMSEIGYDAMTVGNRDFHFSRIGFYSKLSRARFPILCANVRLSGTLFSADEVAFSEENVENVQMQDLPVLSYLVKEMVSGLRVVVFGITVPMITEQMLVRKVSAYVFEQPIVSASRLTPWLRKQFAPDLLIALTHIGIQQDRVLAQQVSGIDLIIGGHTHTALVTGERVGDTLIVQAGARGQFYGRVTAIRQNNKLVLNASLEVL